jgi:[ribosomal protein S18]-alanine N-acetyltransferase
MVSVRPAKTLDFESIYELECKCFKTPWEKQLFFEDFSANPNSLWWVAIIDRKIIGFCGLWRQFDEMHIINVCVDPQFRRLGAAKMLVASMMTKAGEEQVRLFLLEVRVSNIAARKLYEGFGFKDMYIRKKYYQDNDEDAIVMMKEK